MKRIAFVCSLLLGATCGTGISFAKKADAPAGPFQMGSVLKQISSIPMTTAEISAFMPEMKDLFVVGGENVLEVVDGRPCESEKGTRSQVAGGCF